VEFDAIAQSNSGRGCYKVANTSVVYHASTLIRLLIAETFESEGLVGLVKLDPPYGLCNVAGQRVAHCGLDFSKYFWPLRILLFGVAMLMLWRTDNATSLPHVLTKCTRS
jgi:hypothetical protein